MQGVGRSTVSQQGRSKRTTNQGFFTQTQLANNANLGRLPTLGLNTIKAEDFGDDSRNPFYVQGDTTKMLVVRELEREFKDLNKFEKDAMRIHDKQISTRLDRAGAITEVAAIPPSKDNAQVNVVWDQQRCLDLGISPPQNKKGGKRGTVALQGQAQEENAAAMNKQKLNIFDT